MVQLLGEVLGVAVVGADVLEKLRGVLGARAAFLGEFREVLEDADVVCYSAAQELQVGC